MFFQQLVNGLTLGATYALVAVGFTMVYGVLELINFANGAFYVLGGYMTVLFLTGAQVGLFPALLFSCVGSGILGVSMNLGILQPIRARKVSGTSQLIATIGVSTVITNLIIFLFGSETKRFPDILNLGRIHLGDVIVTWTQVIICILAIVTMIVLSIITYTTKIGRGMRAIAQNIGMAQYLGVNVKVVVSVAFFLGTMCAAMAGSMVAMYNGSIDTTLYVSVGLKTFASAILGGVGILPGAMLGGLIVGLLETMVSAYISSAYKDAITFIILILVLIFRPNGLLGQKRIVKV